MSGVQSGEPVAALDARSDEFGLVDSDDGSNDQSRRAQASVEAVLSDCGSVIVACSGGIDSLLLATIAHRHRPSTTIIAHTVTPAVPGEGTARVMAHARRRGWRLEVVRSKEFDDERYLSNPTDRCYFCKTHLYDAIGSLGELGAVLPGATVVSGANLDDLGEYRPGLIAADEHEVRHPYVEAGLTKDAIRAVARSLDLDEADLPASPCLASRLYTGTRVTEARLRAVALGEAVVQGAGMPVARCRIRDDRAIVEVPEADRSKITEELLDHVALAMQTVAPDITTVTLDDRPYRPGQAVLKIT